MLYLSVKYSGKLTETNIAISRIIYIKLILEHHEDNRLGALCNMLLPSVGYETFMNFRETIDNIVRKVSSNIFEQYLTTIEYYKIVDERSLNWEDCVPDYIAYIDEYGKLNQLNKIAYDLDEIK